MGAAGAVADPSARFPECAASLGVHVDAGVGHRIWLQMAHMVFSDPGRGPAGSGAIAGVSAGLARDGRDGFSRYASKTSPANNESLAERCAQTFWRRSLDLDWCSALGGSTPARCRLGGSCGSVCASPLRRFPSPGPGVATRGRGCPIAHAGADQVCFVERILGPAMECGVQCAGLRICLPAIGAQIWYRRRRGDADRVLRLGLGARTCHLCSRTGRVWAADCLFSDSRFGSFVRTRGAWPKTRLGPRLAGLVVCRRGHDYPGVLAFPSTVHETICS